MSPSPTWSPRNVVLLLAMSAVPLQHDFLQTKRH